MLNRRKTEEKANITMGASQSDLENFKDPGPAVTEKRIIRQLAMIEISSLFKKICSDQ